MSGMRGRGGVCPERQEVRTMQRSTIRGVGGAMVVAAALTSSAPAWAAAAQGEAEGKLVMVALLASVVLLDVLLVVTLRRH